MLKEGCLVPMAFIIFGFGYLLIEDLAKDSNFVLVKIKGDTSTAFRISEYSLERLEKEGSLNVKCGERILTLEPSMVSKIKEPFDVSESDVPECDRL